MNAAVADSFDGRYFGPIAATAIIGKAQQLWTDEPDGTRITKPTNIP